MRTPRGDWRGLRKDRNAAAPEPVGTAQPERITVTCADTYVIARPQSQAGREKRVCGEAGGEWVVALFITDSRRQSVPRLWRKGKAEQVASKA